MLASVCRNKWFVCFRSKSKLNPTSGTLSNASRALGIPAPSIDFLKLYNESGKVIFFSLASLDLGVKNAAFHWKGIKRPPTADEVKIGHLSSIADVIEWEGWRWHSWKRLINNVSEVVSYSQPLTSIFGLVNSSIKEMRLEWRLHPLHSMHINIRVTCKSAINNLPKFHWKSSRRLWV